MISFAKTELKRLQLLGYVQIRVKPLYNLLFKFYRLFVGHVGDGNFHVILIFDSENSDEIQRIHEFGTILAKYKFIRLLFIISVHL